MAIIGSGNDLFPGRSQAYLNQCWFIANWTHENHIQGNFNHNKIDVYKENTYENIYNKKSAIFNELIHLPPGQNGRHFGRRCF